MKYSLRSLMIVVTLVCVGLGGGISWWKHREFCLRMAEESAQFQGSVSVIAVNGDETDSELEALQATSKLKDQERDNKLKRIEQAYRRAVWFPWERRWINESPTEY